VVGGVDAVVAVGRVGPPVGVEQRRLVAAVDPAVAAVARPDRRSVGRAGAGRGRRTAGQLNELAERVGGSHAGAAGAVAQQDLAEGDRAGGAVGDATEFDALVEQEDAIAGDVVAGVDAGADVAGVVVAGVDGAWDASVEVAGAGEQLDGGGRGGQGDAGRGRLREVDQVFQAFLLNERQQVGLGGEGLGPGVAAGGEIAKGVVVHVQGQAELVEVVPALDALGHGADLLDGGQQQPDQDGNDGEDDEQLNQG